MRNIHINYIAKFTILHKLILKQIFKQKFKPDADHPQHQLRCDRAVGVPEDHLPEHHQGDEGDDLGDLIGTNVMVIIN